MLSSTLSEMDTGTYIDGDGDIVFVFTDKDMKNKSFILQLSSGQPFGRYARMNDGYYEEDYSPYMPVRLFMPNIKRPYTPACNIEKIELDEECDGAWVGDQGTLIIHRSDVDPGRMLHVMFSYDTYNELKFVLCNFSPIFSRFRKEEKFLPIMEDELLTAVPVASKETNVSDHTRETFRDKLDDIQKQIDQMKEKVSNAYDLAQAAITLSNTCGESILKLKREHGDHLTMPALPDSNGFWRDKDGDIWAYDGNSENSPIMLFDTGVCEVYGQQVNVHANWINLDFYAPFTKIDNPFIQGEDHAN